MNPKLEIECVRNRRKEKQAGGQRQTDPAAPVEILSVEEEVDRCHGREEGCADGEMGKEQENGGGGKGRGIPDASSGGTAPVSIEDQDREQNTRGVVPALPNI